MDEYGNWIYLTPMVLGGFATALAAAWKFLGIAPFANDGPLDALYALVRRIRKADTEAAPQTIEDEIDDILKAQRAKAAAGDEDAVDAATLNVAAHRLERFDSRSTADACPESLRYHGRLEKSRRTTDVRRTVKVDR